jgi:hypothetical protein
VKIFRGRAETLLLQNLQQIFEMTKLSVVVHTGALREALILRGTDEGHDICPILLLHLSLAQGNQQKNKMNACTRTRKALKGMPV